MIWKRINEKWAKSVKAKFYGRRTGVSNIGSKPINEKEKLKILTMYKNGMKSVKIAEELGRHTTTICRVLKGFKIDAINHHKISESEINKITELYIQGKTIRELHEMYSHLGITSGAINYHLRKKGVTRKNGKQAVIDHDYFETIDTEKKAYFLGLIAADGSLMKQQKSINGYSFVLRLELMANDRYIIEELVKELKSDLKVREYKSSNNRNGWKEKHNAYAQFHSEKIFKDLGKHGLHPNKTVNLSELPIISRELFPHYVRGFFDGDGTVYINKDYKQPRPIFGFYGTYEFISNLQSYLTSEINLNKRKITTQKNADVSFVTYSTVENIKDFYEYIYKDATIFLKRKKEKFDSCIKNI